MNLKYNMLTTDATGWMIPVTGHAGESKTIETENSRDCQKMVMGR